MAKLSEIKELADIEFHLSKIPQENLAFFNINVDLPELVNRLYLLRVSLCREGVIVD